MALPLPLPPRWHDVAAAQAGVLSRRQALLGGLTEDAWQWRLDLGRWTPLLPGVVATHSGEPTWAEKIWGAVLYAGPGAAVSGDAGLTLGGFVGLNEAMADVAIPRGRAVAAREFLRPHQVRGLAGLVAAAREPPRVRLPHALLHSVAWAPTARAAEWRIAAAVQQRLVRPDQIDGALALVPRLPRRALVRAVLTDVRQGAHAQTELDFLRLLRRHGLPLPDRLQLVVRAGGKRYLDVWWERKRVTVELDGAHHRSAGTWDADTLRANAVAVAQRHDRLLLLRFTTGNLRHDEQQVVAQLRAALL